MRAAPHTVLKDTYRLERVLGQGAMGEVWDATHLSLGTQVAVKILHPGAGAVEEVRARFAQEARLIAQIDNPHVVRVIDYGTTPEGDPFLVMERLAGGDLGARVAAMGWLSVAETADVVRQACAGLASAHALGIVHRDIKPANVFLHATQGTTRVKVLDFGVAKVVSPGALGMTRTEALVGTPYYMSPEQLVDSRAIDHRSDLWAVGVMAYECLTGRRPFAGESIGALTLAMHNTRPPPPSSLRPDLPRGLDAWFERALAVRPEDRYPNATELADGFVAAMMTTTLPMGEPRARGPVVVPGGSSPPLGATLPSRGATSGGSGKAIVFVVAGILGVVVLAAGLTAFMLYAKRHPQREAAEARARARASAAGDQIEKLIELPTPDGPPPKPSAKPSAEAVEPSGTMRTARATGAATAGAPVAGDGGTIVDPSLGNVVNACWRTRGASEAAGKPSAATITIAMEERGAGAKRTTVSGPAAAFPAFRQCAMEGASSTAQRWGRSREGKMVTYSAALPACPFVPGNGTYVCP